MCPKNRLKEDNIPTDRRGKPDLSGYTDSPETYANMYEEYLDSIGTRTSGAGGARKGYLAFRRRLHAVWGLIANGAAAVPYALGRLLRQDDPIQVALAWLDKYE